jgi:hypothetical protein
MNTRIARKILKNNHRYNRGQTNRALARLGWRIITKQPFVCLVGPTSIGKGASKSWADTLFLTEKLSRK